MSLRLKLAVRNLPEYFALAVERSQRSLIARGLVFAMKYDDEEIEKRLIEARLGIPWDVIPSLVKFGQGDIGTEELD
ncbi:MAG: hypothetical protein AAB909_03580, partial [Patescibacteria group bacterium]